MMVGRKISRWVLMSGVAVAALTGAVPAHAEDSYTPPPLFGSAPAQVVTPAVETPIIPVKPAPIQVPAPEPKIEKHAAEVSVPRHVPAAKPAPEAPRPAPVAVKKEQAPVPAVAAVPPPIVETVPTLPPADLPAVTVAPAPRVEDISSGKAALSEAASPAERVGNPVQVMAPLDADSLLEYPADRVSENAVASLQKMAEQTSKNLSVPDFEPYPDAPSVAPATEKKTPPAKAESDPAGSGKIDKVDIISGSKKDDAAAKKKSAAKKPEDTAKATAAAKPEAADENVRVEGDKVIRKTVIKSPRVVPKGNTEAEGDKPKVAVYTRDEKTGTFKRTDPKIIPIKPKAKTAEETAVARAVDKAKEQAQAQAKTKKGNMPAVPPAAVEASDLLAGTSVVSDIPALDDDLSAQILSAADTSQTSSEKVAPPLPALNTANKAMVGTGSPDDVVLGDQHVLLPFKAGAGDLDAELRGRIDENVTARLTKEPGLRVEIRAYAPGVADEPSSDRRLSLSRGLAVREYLKNQGIDPARMNIRAMGKNTERQPLDRVDVVFLRGG